MPRNPISYFKTSLMQTLNSSLNDSQNSVVYPIDVQKKIDEVYKRLQAPNNSVNINYNTGNLVEENSSLKKLVRKLASANEAISNLKQLNKNNTPPNSISKIREIGDKEISMLKKIVDESMKDPNINKNSVISFKQSETQTEDLNKSNNSDKIRKDNVINEEKVKNITVLKDEKPNMEFDYDKVIKDLKNNNKNLREIGESLNSTITKMGLDKNTVNSLSKSWELGKNSTKEILQKINNFTADDTLSKSNKSDIIKDINDISNNLVKSKIDNSKINKVNNKQSILHNSVNYIKNDTVSKEVNILTSPKMKQSISSNASKLKQFMKENREKMRKKRLEESKTINETKFEETQNILIDSIASTQKPNLISTNINQSNLNIEKSDEIDNSKVDDEENVNGPII